MNSIFSTEDMSESKVESRNSNVWYKQRFKREWLENPEFKTWLRPISGSQYGAMCIICNCTLKNSKITSFLAHQKSTRHLKMCKRIDKELMESEQMLEDTKEIKIGPFIENEPESESTKKVSRAELLLSAFVAEHSMPVSQTEEFIEVLKMMCPDSEIAQGLTMDNVRASCTSDENASEGQAAGVNAEDEEGNAADISNDPTWVADMEY